MAHYNYDQNSNSPAPPVPPPRARIVVHDHDVLSGRGVNIAVHPGNQRLRTLVTTRADDSFCTSYSASEKRAVADKIIKHIKQLDPPGRFLKRDGRFKGSRGLTGPWEEQTEREAVKKVCQALRDCNRPDRQGYAAGVAIPSDVVDAAKSLQSAGLTGKQHAARAAAEVAAAQAAATISNSKRDWGRVSPSVENAAEWLKKQRTDDNATVTPSTSGSDMANGDRSSYDPTLIGAPSTYDSFPTSAQYASAPSPIYTPAPIEVYPQAAGPSYESGLGAEGFSQTQVHPHFPTAQSTDTYQPATLYHMDASPMNYQHNPSPAPFARNGTHTPAPAAPDPTNPVSPELSNPTFGYSLTQNHPSSQQQTFQVQPMYTVDLSRGQSHDLALPLYPQYSTEAPPAPTRACHVFAQGTVAHRAPSPYGFAPAPTDGGGQYHGNAYGQPSPRTYHRPYPSNGGSDLSPASMYHAAQPHSYHLPPATAYQATSLQPYHSSPMTDYDQPIGSEYERDPTTGYDGVPSQQYQLVPGLVAHQAAPAPTPLYATALGHGTYHTPVESAPTRQQPTEPNLRSGAHPIASYKYSTNMTDYQSFSDSSIEHQNQSSHTFSGTSGTLPDREYNQGHVSTASAGADLLISAAYQTTANDHQQVQTGGNFSNTCTSAKKWDGKPLRL